MSGNRKLLVSVRGPVEAISAARGGAHVSDVEYPGSALGSPYALNIKVVRERLNSEGFMDLPVSIPGKSSGLEELRVRVPLELLWLGWISSSVGWLD